MFGLRSRAAAFAALALFSATPARATWVETRIKSHTAVVDVDRKGVARVSEEVLLAVRGGPLRSFEIAGGDPDAVLEEGATATPVVRFGTPTPIPLTIARQDDGTLRIEIERDKGLFTGGYVFRFAYRTELLTRDRIRRRGTAAEIEWIGPRFADGIDVAKTIFRLPSAPVAPTLAAGPSGEDAELGSAFVSAVRHVDDKVELELVRPHVAKGEPAVWRILADPKSFDGLADAGPSPIAERASRVVPIERPAERVAWLGGALLVALLYGALLGLKWRWFQRDAQASGARPRALVLPRLPLALRAALSGSALAGALLIGALGDEPSVAAALLLLSMSLAALRAPELTSSPRAPGRWFALTDQEAFAAGSEKRRGRWLDLGERVGFASFALLLSGFVTGGVVLAAHSPYHSLGLLLASACLLPIFATGRGSGLPVDRVLFARRFLSRLKSRLGARRGLKVVAWARIPEGLEKPDETRILLRPSLGVDGLAAVEVGVEQLPSLAGFSAMPFVLVRAREGSQAEALLAAHARLQRGRAADERVAIFKPALASVAETALLLDELLRLLGFASAGAATRRRAPAMVSRLGVASPAQAASS